MGRRREVWSSFPGERIPSSKSKRKPSPICPTRWPRVLGYRGRTCGRPSGTQYEASGVKPDRHIIKGLHFHISPICTLSQNGYGDLRRRRLYIRLIRMPACTELRRCRRSGALRDAASSRSHCPHIYSTTQSASATASSWRFAPTSHASFCSRPRPSTCGFNLE